MGIIVHVNLMATSYNVMYLSKPPIHRCALQCFWTCTYGNKTRKPNVVAPWWCGRKLLCYAVLSKHARPLFFLRKRSVVLKSEFWNFFFSLIYLRPKYFQIPDSNFLNYLRIVSSGDTNSPFITEYSNKHYSS